MDHTNAKLHLVMRPILSLGLSFDGLDGGTGRTFLVYLQLTRSQDIIHLIWRVTVIVEIENTCYHVKLEL